MKRLDRFLLWLVLLYSVFSHAYPIIRYGGNWLDGDPAVMAAVTKATMQTGHLSTPGLPAYAGGFGYQTLIAFISSVTGMAVLDVQSHVRPFMGVFVILASFIVFRRLFQNSTHALIATALFCVSPYRLFVTAEGSHMAPTLTLLLIGIWTWIVLLRSKGVGNSSLVLVLLAVLFGFVSVNVFFALSTLISFAGAFLAATALGRATERGRYRRLGTTTLFGVVVLFSVILFAYRPAIALLTSLPNLSGVLSTIFLSFGEPTLSSYTGVTVIWSSSLVYFLLILFELLTIPLSVAAWAWYGMKLRRIRSDPSNDPWIFVWLFNGIMGLQIAVTLLLDVFGGFGLGNNLALRLEPVYLVTAIPLVVRFVASLIETRDKSIKLPHRRKSLTAIALVILAVLAVGAPLRAFVDPIVAPGSWVQFSPGEENAALWIARFAPSGSIIYTQPIYTNSQASRIVWLYTMESEPSRYGDISFPTHYPIASGNTNETMYFTSREEAARLPYLTADLPDISSWSLLFDNGDAQIFCDC